MPLDTPIEPVGSSSRAAEPDARSFITSDLALPAEQPDEGARAATATVADGVERRLDPRVIEVQRLAGWIGTASAVLVMAAVLLPIALLTRLPVAAAVGLAVFWMATTLAMVWSTLRWPAIAHRYTSYVVSADGIEIRRGVIWRTVINVPRFRVQHTDVSQGPIERRFGLGTLTTYTAGTDYAQVRLHGLDRGTALRIRDHLLSRDVSDAV